MEFDFKGQTALVSGGTRGIGRAISEAFLKAGAKVVATYLSNHEEAKKFKQANADHASFLEIHQFNVTDETPKSSTGSFEVPLGRVVSLYFIICVSSGKASNNGMFSIASP